jgi:GH3 auxin-responsive promoter
MKIINTILSVYLRHIYKDIELSTQNPHDTQRRILLEWISRNEHTEWGKRYGFKHIKSPEDYAKHVPVQDYDAFKQDINRMMHGESDILWVGQVLKFSKSSGTTSDKSKFIPVTEESLIDCHIKGGWDASSSLYHLFPDIAAFEGKTMLSGGSYQRFPAFPKVICGDVSALMIQNLPFIGKIIFSPDIDTALLGNWNEKINKMAQVLPNEDIRIIGGVPTWIVVLFRKILENTGAKNMLEVWPNLKVYFHGGVSFLPYKEQFQQFFPSNSIRYVETYNASEGFFAATASPEDEGMRLLMNNGVYYEFIPEGAWHETSPQAVPLQAVEVGKQYAMVITTNAGLWRYALGDTVIFTSVMPYHIKITGRTKQFINAFGEEVMVANTDNALAETCKMTNAIVSEYTAAPSYFSAKGKGRHEWVVEFEREPNDIAEFAELLDKNLQTINSDYEAKRFGSMALETLHLYPAPKGTFISWMQQRGKYGGQHKVPRLSNDRKYIDDLLAMSFEP